MPRPRRTTLADDLFTLARRLPWWLSLTAAVLSWAVLHALAQQDVPLSTGIDDLGEFAGRRLVKTLATAGQYLLPGLFGAGALASLFRTRQRQQLFDHAVTGHTANALHTLSWQQFEQVIGEAFRRKAFNVKENGGGGADGGVDLVLEKGRDRYLVQCKHWRAQRVGVAVIRELFEAMTAQHAAGSYVVTSGSFTDDARAFAAGRNIELIDGQILSQWLSQYQREKLRIEKTEEPAANPTTRHTSSPCPVCSGLMVRRIAKRGANAGNTFWGCSRFPSCKGTRAIE